MQIVFKKTKLEVEILSYQNNDRLAIELTEVKSGEPYLTASVNIPDEPLKDKEICIKNYHENEGILQCLIDNKIVSYPVRYVRNANVNIPICNLLIEK